MEPIVSRVKSQMSLLLRGQEIGILHFIQLAHEPVQVGFTHTVSWRETELYEMLLQVISSICSITFDFRKGVAYRGRARSISGSSANEAASCKPVFGEIGPKVRSALLVASRIALRML